jgi:hypothetical protein
METQVATNPKVSLLRVDQIEEMEGEREGMRKKLQNPNIQDKGIVADQLRKLDTQLETQRPREFSSAEIDNAVRREASLREEWSKDMLSAEEMRKCPPGAVDRHLAWERKNKAKISEWQNIMRRLNAGSDAREIASIERFRPEVNTLNMHNAIVAGKTYFNAERITSAAVVFSDEQIAMLKTLDPSLAEKIGLLSNAQRGEVKEVLSKAQIDGKRGVEKREATKKEKVVPVPVPVVEKPKRVLSPEHLAKLKAGRDKAKLK